MQDYCETPILNKRYNFINHLDHFAEGTTSKVYLVEDMKEQQKAVVKYFKAGYIDYKEEMKILQSISHPTCIRMIETCDDGTLVKPSGKVVRDINFIVTEYINGLDLLDFCKEIFGDEGMGESFARFIMHQALDSLQYIHS